jgi:hypothetical protein
MIPHDGKTNPFDKPTPVKVFFYDREQGENSNLIPYNTMSNAIIWDNQKRRPDYQIRGYVQLQTDPNSVTSNPNGRFWVVGDAVKVVNKSLSTYGRTGEIVKIENVYQVWVKVKGHYGPPLRYNVKSLAPLKDEADDDTFCVGILYQVDMDFDIQKAIEDDQLNENHILMVTGGKKSSVMNDIESAIVHETHFMSVKDKKYYMSLTRTPKPVSITKPKLIKG